MTVPQLKSMRAREVWRRLSAVTDPELDEPVTDMGFIESIDVSRSGEVHVTFRLPTYWCSPNFAFLMAEGIVRAASAPSWATKAKVELMDHCFADRVNACANDHLKFEEVFAELTDGEDLSELRDKFLEKAYLRRQESVLQGLIAMQWSPAQITALTLAEFDLLNLANQPTAAAQKPRYRELLVQGGRANMPHDKAFVTWDGTPLTPRDFETHLARLRSLRINMEFNGALCRGLAKSRYKSVDLSGEEPELIDFIMGRVPPRDPALDGSKAVAI